VVFTLNHQSNSTSKNGAILGGGGKRREKDSLVFSESNSRRDRKSLSSRGKRERSDHLKKGKETALSQGEALGGGPQASLG